MLSNTRKKLPDVRRPDANAELLTLGILGMLGSTSPISCNGRRRSDGWRIGSPAAAASNPRSPHHGFLQGVPATSTSGIPSRTRRQIPRRVQADQDEDSGTQISETMPMMAQALDNGYAASGDEPTRPTDCSITPRRSIRC